MGTFDCWGGGGGGGGGGTCPQCPPQFLHLCGGNLCSCWRSGANVLSLVRSIEVADSVSWRLEVESTYIIILLWR